jgi:hypothetical protein
MAAERGENEEDIFLAVEGGDGKGWRWSHGASRIVQILQIYRRNLKNSMPDVQN